MPEIAELKIMSEFINKVSCDKLYHKIYDVQKGIHSDITNDLILSNFKIKSNSYGKTLFLDVQNKKLSFFMGMSGNWKFLSTKDINSIKFIRLRFDTIDGYSLLCYGGYMGPKWKLGYFSSKKGPDPIQDFDKFKLNILDNLDNKDFDKPIYECLLNQKWFCGIGNYLRSTIIYYSNINPFQSGRQAIKNNIHIIELCKDIPDKAYELNGGQLKDWKNPLDVDDTKFKEWVFYQKGNKIKDSNGRTFWYDPKWESNIKNK